MTVVDPERLSPTETLSGRSIYLLGATGFLGKVFLALLLHRFPGMRRIYVMVRPGSGTDSEARFYKDVVGSPVFDPLRERYGGALEGMLRDKVRVTGGDITRDNLGLSEEEAQAVAGEIDVLVNSSGRVTFNPALDQSLRTNVTGTKNVIAFAKRMRRPCLIHVSTCFVAGNRSGEIWEDEAVEGFFPRGEELENAVFSAEQEIADCAKLAQRVRQEAEEAVLAAELRAAARQRLRDEGRDPDHDRFLRLAVARERKNWIRQRLTDLGIERAARWGWPNIYCYSKSLAEQLVAAEPGLVRAIVRPSIVESAQTFPFPGWNEGFTTSAPIVFLALKGQYLIPCSDKLILDLIPVDHVASGLAMITAQACAEKPQLVYQLCSGDENPLRMQRMVTLLGLHKRQHFQDKDEGHRVVNEALARMETRTASFEDFSRSGVPLLNRTARKVTQLIDRARPRWGGSHLADVLDAVRDKVERVTQVTQGVEDVFEMYRPFVGENHYVFRADNIRRLAARVPAAERSLTPWKIGELDWHEYSLEIHYPGLHRWVLPELEQDFAAQPKLVYTYNHLVELFDTTSKIYAKRVAMRMLREGHRDQYTYAELQELATRAAGFLAAQGVQAGDRVLLCSENQPEWAMAYFGVLKAGATCVPVDRESSAAEIANLARAARVRGVLVSDNIAAKREGLLATLAAGGGEEPAPAMALWRFADVFAEVEEGREAKRRALLPARVQRDDVASLIFTSGTTGRPKGVMLTHRNFAFLVSELAQVFDFSARDGMLSVLPLHHTFEFAAGLLMPLSRGAQVTYLSELTSESISAALGEGKTTAIIGVPALWELLYRRIRSRLGEGPRWAEWLLNQLIRMNSWIQQKSPFDLGRLLFMVIHNRFGGRIRYLISGGSALGDHVKQLFHGLGMPIHEGYGLTEAAPVLTVARPGEGLLLGSVGQPLPHVDLRILEPDHKGVGEVLARGHNVMVGYFEDDAATADTVRDGWLHTGDLGYLDEERNLYIVGRSKDVIVDQSGKNVYPDELDELYGDAALIKELSVVGLPDGTAERVAALVVPDYAAEPELSREQVQERVREAIRAVSADLPFYKRIKTLHLWDGELPRTATRKVKRREVVAELLRLDDLVAAASKASAGAEQSKEEWLIGVVASVCGKPRRQITIDARLDALGFDSLMYTELGVALEAAGGRLRTADRLADIGTLQALLHAVERAREGSVRREEIAEVEPRAAEIQVPPPVARAGQRVLGASQWLAYNVLLRTKVEGQAHIPYHTNFIVAPNHCSHADIGLVRTALKDAGRNLRVLAAADYFFDSRYKRAIYENFTSLVPMDRTGAAHSSLRRAVELLRRGYNVLIFAEGTRSETGEMTDFKATLGYLALHGKVGILPMYLRGTHEVLPKGANMIRARDVGGVIGPLLSVEDIAALTAGLPRAESYRLVAAAAQHLVEGLRDGVRRPGVAQLRAGWDGAAGALSIGAERESR